MRPFRQAPARRWYISGIVLRRELIGTRAIRVLLGDGIRQWFHTGAIAYPCQLLALSPSPEAEDLLTRFGFHCAQKAHAMPDRIALFVLDVANCEEFLSFTTSSLYPHRSDEIVFEVCKFDFPTTRFWPGTTPTTMCTSIGLKPLRIKLSEYDLSL
jgi:hypothetical protein